MLRRLLHFCQKHKVIRGMLAYGTLWPIASIIEQTISEKRNFRTYDYPQCLRYSLYGGVILAPTLYGWVKFLPILYPGRSFRMAFWKAILEQICFEPFSISTFLYIMSLMEGKKHEEAILEVHDKYFRAYRIALIYWPIVQTVNFALIPTQNQVVFVSFFSLIWSTILAFIKAQKKDASFLD